MRGIREKDATVKRVSAEKSTANALTQEFLADRAANVRTVQMVFVKTMEILLPTNHWECSHINLKVASWFCNDLDLFILFLFKTRIMKDILRQK